MGAKINLLEGRIGKYGMEENDSPVSQPSEERQPYKMGRRDFLKLLGVGVLGTAFGEIPVEIENALADGNKLKIYVGNFEQKNIKYPYGKSFETRDIADTVRSEIEKGFQNYFTLVSRPDSADVVISGICVVGSRAGEWIVDVKLRYEFNGEVIHSNLDNWFPVDDIDPATKINNPYQYTLGRKNLSIAMMKYANELNDIVQQNKVKINIK